LVGPPRYVRVGAVALRLVMHRTGRRPGGLLTVGDLALRPGLTLAAPPAQAEKTE